MTSHPHVRVAVVGTGFSGIGTAIALKRSGRQDFVLFERHHEVGGTWYVNTYPGCACDVPSQVYSLSYELHPEWSHTYARQPEIQDYLMRVVAKHDLRRHVVFGAEVTDARWDGTVWEVETTAGTWTADVLVSATGGLSEPAQPDIPGLSSFRGDLFHSAEWQQGWSGEGKRVGVIGTGSSSIQLVPHVQRQAEQLVLFQRTASWVLPRRDKAIPGWRKAAYRRLPALQRLARVAVYWQMEWRVLAFQHPRIMKLGEKQATAHLEAQVSDPVLREKLRPSFTMGCKRVLLSNTYYPALSQPNASVVTDRIVQVVPEGVVTEAADGSRTTHALDSLVLSTGFKVQDPPLAHRVSAHGQTLAEHWKKTGLTALHGTTIHGFPNLFFLMGPNTALGHNSVVLMVEAQIDHLVDLLDHLDRTGGRTFEPRLDVQEAEDRRIQRALEPTVWNSGGCSSWYKDDSGRNTTIWPGATFTYMRQMRAFRPEEYLTA